MDNNKYDTQVIKKIIKRKIKIIKIIIVDQSRNIKNKYLNYVNDMYNPKKYWELEGIKISSNL